MSGVFRITGELREWAVRTGYSVASAWSPDDRVVLWTNNGELRYFVTARDDGWFTVTESERMGEEALLLAAVSAPLIEQYFFGLCGKSFRHKSELPRLKYPSTSDELAYGFGIAEVDFGGKERRGLIDSAGDLVAVSSGGRITSVAELAQLSVYINSSLADVKHSFEDSEGRPLFEVWRENATPTGDDFTDQFAQGFANAGGSSEASSFTVVEDTPAIPEAAIRDEQTHAQASAMVDRIAQELAYLGPPDWQELNAAFALTVRAAAAQLQFITPSGSVSLRVPDAIVNLVREQRAVSAQMSAGPWWRLIMTVTNQGLLTVSYDYGEDPFPDDQLQPPENYRDDLITYPRPPLPVWLAGYIAGPAAQGRTPQQATAAETADRAAGRHPTKTDDLEPLSETWARWAVLAAIYVGARSPWGPRLSPGLAWYESDARSGSTLAVLPGNRAVLSGGRWNSPLLVAAYQHHQPLPDLYAGAPAWVSDSVLNTRNQNGLLSFCYWWTDGSWWRGAANTFDELDDPIPQIWTPAETVGKVVEVIGPGTEQACFELVDAAAKFAAAKQHLAAALSRLPDADVDAAYNQLVVAGVAT